MGTLKFTLYQVFGGNVKAPLECFINSYVLSIEGGKLFAKHSFGTMNIIREFHHNKSYSW